MQINTSCPIFYNSFHCNELLITCKTIPYRLCLSLPIETCFSVDIGYQIFGYHDGNTGTYLIKAKAKNTEDLESDWRFLEITMPKNKIHTYPLLEFILKMLTIILPNMHLSIA